MGPMLLYPGDLMGSREGGGGEARERRILKLLKEELGIRKVGEGEGREEEERRGT